MNDKSINPQKIVRAIIINRSMMKLRPDLKDVFQDNISQLYKQLSNSLNQNHE